MAVVDMPLTSLVARRMARGRLPLQAAHSGPVSSYKPKQELKIYNVKEEFNRGFVLTSRTWCHVNCMGSEKTSWLTFVWNCCREQHNSVFKKLNSRAPRNLSDILHNVSANRRSASDKITRMMKTKQQVAVAENVAFCVGGQWHSALYFPKEEVSPDESVT